MPQLPHATTERNNNIGNTIIIFQAISSVKRYKFIIRK